LNALDSHTTSFEEGASAYGGILIDGNSQHLFLNYEADGNISRLATVNTDLSHLTNDMNLRLVVEGNFLSLTAWPTGDDEPEEPQVTAELPEIFSDVQGRVGVFVGNRDSSVPVAFRYVSVVPEPSSLSWVLPLMMALFAGRRRTQ
jgi:hypothetical protein